MKPEKQNTQEEQEEQGIIEITELPKNEIFYQEAEKPAPYIDESLELQELGTTLDQALQNYKDAPTSENKETLRLALVDSIEQYLADLANNTQEVSHLHECLEFLLQKVLEPLQEFSDGAGNAYSGFYYGLEGTVWLTYAVLAGGVVNFLEKILAILKEAFPGNEIDKELGLSQKFYYKVLETIGKSHKVFEIAKIGNDIFGMYGFILSFSKAFLVELDKLIYHTTDSSEVSELDASSDQSLYSNQYAQAVCGLITIVLTIPYGYLSYINYKNVHNRDSQQSKPRFLELANKLIAAACCLSFFAFVFQGQDLLPYTFVFNFLIAAIPTVIVLLSETTKGLYKWGPIVATIVYSLGIEALLELSRTSGFPLDIGLDWLAVLYQDLTNDNYDIPDGAFWSVVSTSIVLFILGITKIIGNLKEELKNPEIQTIFNEARVDNVMRLFSLVGYLKDLQDKKYPVMSGSMMKAWIERLETYSTGIAKSYEARNSSVTITEVKEETAINERTPLLTLPRFFSKGQPNYDVQNINESESGRSQSVSGLSKCVIL